MSATGGETGEGRDDAVQRTRQDGIRLHHSGGESSQDKNAGAGYGPDAHHGAASRLRGAAGSRSPA